MNPGEAGEAARAALAAALRQGSGRAMVLLRAHPGAPDLGAELLRACRQDLVHDPQCEPPRARYLHRLLAEAGPARGWFDALLPALADGDGARPFAVLCRLAADDPGIDRAPLRRHLAALPLDAATAGPMEALVTLEGAAAVVLCAEVFGDATRDRDGAFGDLVAALEGRDGAAAAAALKRARAGSPALHALLSRPVPAPPAPDSKPPDDDAVLAALAAGRVAPLRWIRVAGEAALRAIAQALAAAPDDAARIRGLRVFAHRDYPGLAADLVALAQSPAQRVAHGAALALARLAHPAARALALALLDEGRHPGRAMRLLRRNFEAGDLARVAAMLAAPPADGDALHDLGCALIELVDGGAVPVDDARGLMVWLYERGPCSICRARAVERLAAAGCLPGWMAEEAPFDANRDTVEAAAGIEPGGTERPTAAASAPPRPGRSARPPPRS